MRVLIACEYSGVVRDAFIRRGHEAWSCDLDPSESDLGPHYQGDVFTTLRQPWDIIIAHPPCTYLAVSGNRHYGEGTEGYEKRLEAAEWTARLWEQMKQVSNVGCALENPVSVLTRLAGLPKPQYVQPWQFGHTEQKKTALHLHNLPPLVPTDDVYEEMMKLPKKERQRTHYASPGPSRGKDRSKTFQGIADAMADQWGNL